MKPKLLAIVSLVSSLHFSAVQAQTVLESSLCEAAKTGLVVEIVYDKDESKGCLPRIVDVHQVAVGNNGKFYMHGWQTRGCTKGRDYASKRIFRLDKVKSAEIIAGIFDEKSQSIKTEGWDGCIGSNCFIKENICE